MSQSGGARAPGFSGLGNWKTRLEAALPGYLRRQRWFAGKARGLKRASVEGVVPLPGSRLSALVMARAHYRSGASELYSLPLLYASRRPAVSSVVSPAANGGFFVDALADPEFCAGLLASIRDGGVYRGSAGRVAAVASASLLRAHPAGSRLPPPKPMKAEQSNTSLLFADRWMLKWYRRLHEGVHPELEVLQALSSKTSFRNIPSYGGHLEYLRPGKKMALGVLQGFVVSDGDAWGWAVGEARRFLQSKRAAPDERALAWAGLLGRRIAQFHAAMCSVEGEGAFAPKRFRPSDRRALRRSLRAQAGAAFALLGTRAGRLSSASRADARLLKSLRGEILRRFDAVLEAGPKMDLIRCHGDLHLGQVLRTRGDFVVLDFEGEPARPMGERRLLVCALRDVAGMLRSFEYAAYAAAHAQGVSLRAAAAQYWAQAACRLFLRAYVKEARRTSFLPSEQKAMNALLDIFLLEKGLYELAYELNNRPDWVAIPMNGLLRILGAR